MALAETDARQEEEPMDVGALPPPRTASAELELAGMVKELTSCIRGLQKQVGRIEKQTDEQRPYVTAGPKNPRPMGQSPYVKTKKFGKPAFNQDSSPNCFRCGEAGHIGRNCPLPQKVCRETPEGAGHEGVYPTTAGQWVGGTHSSRYRCL